jgi:uncharacterized RDD family membrane protein YckC
MATAEAVIGRDLNTEKIIEFSPEALAAPFALRVAALTIDYMVLLLLPVVWLVLARFISDTGVPDAIGRTIWTLAILIAIADILLMPMLFGGQSLGKMLVGIRIVRRDGTRVHVAGILLRNLVGYFITVFTFGLGFLFAGLNDSGRALHDYLAGTIVIRGRRRPA